MNMSHQRKLFLVLSIVAVFIIFFCFDGIVRYTPITCVDNIPKTDFEETYSLEAVLDDQKYSSENPSEQPPCGEICTYSNVTIGKPFWIPSTRASIPRIIKRLSCPNIMQRMAWRDHTILNPPPRFPPENLSKEFTQNGEFPYNGERYSNDIPISQSGDKWGNYTREYIDDLLSRKLSGSNLNPYVDHYCFQNILDKYRGYLARLSGLVVGTVSPWVESILLTNKVEHILTLDYNYIDFDHPKLSTCTPYNFADMYLNGEVKSYDFAASFSSIEHSGLGRYGDPLNPYGDFEAMAQTWCALKPGGLFIVGVPGQTGQNGYLRWNAHRYYGPERLKHLAANWHILEVIDCPGDLHAVMVLQKPMEHH